MGAVHCCSSCVGGADAQRPVTGVADWLDDDLDPRIEEPVIAFGGICTCGSQPCAQTGEELRATSSRDGSIRRGNRQEFQTAGGSEAVLSPSSLGAIFKARHRQSQTVHALRQINKKRLQGGVWKDDVEALRQLDHPHICKCEDLWEDSMSVYMIMELCKGGNLTDLSAVRGRFNETGIAVLMEQMVSAVSHMHDQHLVHSDLRPENWLFLDSVSSDSSALDMKLKMIDFGLANKHGKRGRRSFREGLHSSRISGGSLTMGSSPLHSSMKSGASSPGPSCGNSEVGDFGDSGSSVCRLFCLAPEQVLSNGGVHTANLSGSMSDQDLAADTDTPTEKADCWALGIIAFFLLSGQSPFALTNSSPESDASYQNARFVFMPTGIWRPVSAEAKHFISLCLQRDPSLRPSAKQLMSLPWMSLARIAGGQVDADGDLSKLPRARMTLQDPPLPTANAILSSFERMRQFQLIERAAIVAAAFKLPADALHELWRVLQQKDPAQTGMLSLQDLLGSMVGLGVPCQDLVTMSEESGLATSCFMSFSDFVDDVREFQRNTQDHAVWEVFSLFSRDGSERKVRRSQLVKVLSSSQYRQSISSKFPQVSVERVIKDLQEGGSGTLGLDEFKQVVCAAVDAGGRTRRA